MTNGWCTCWSNLTTSVRANMCWINLTTIVRADILYWFIELLKYSSTNFFISLPRLAERAQMPYYQHFFSLTANRHNYTPEPLAELCQPPLSCPSLGPCYSYFHQREGAHRCWDFGTSACNKQTGVGVHPLTRSTPSSKTVALEEGRCRENISDACAVTSIKVKHLREWVTWRPLLYVFNWEYRI